MTEEEFVAEKENLFDAARAAYQRRDIRQGRGDVRRFLAQGVDVLFDVLGMENMVLENAASFGRREKGFFNDPGTLDRIERYLQKAVGSLNGIDNRTRGRAAAVPE